MKTKTMQIPGRRQCSSGNRYESQVRRDPERGWPTKTTIEDQRRGVQEARGGDRETPPVSTDVAGGAGAEGETDHGFATVSVLWDPVLPHPHWFSYYYTKEGEGKCIV